MAPDEESQSFTVDEKDVEHDSRRRRDCYKWTCLSFTTSLVTSVALIGVFYGVLIRRGEMWRHDSRIQNISQPIAEASVERLTKPDNQILYGRFVLQQQRLHDLKNQSMENRLDPKIANHHYKLNWTSEQMDGTTRLKTDTFGCVIIARTGHWLISSKVTFDYSNTSNETQVWVFLTANNGTSTTVPAKKTITLPGNEFRSKRTLLPVDLTDIFYLHENGTLCVEVSEWRIVYASHMDSHLTLVYLS